MSIKAQLVSQWSLIRVLDNNQVSLILDAPVSSASFKLTYNPAVFEYQENSVVSLLKTNSVDSSTPGTIIYDGKINGGRGSKKIGFTFKALKRSETSLFAITDLMLDGEPSEQKPTLVLNTLPYVITSAHTLRVVDDTQPSGGEGKLVVDVDTDDPDDPGDIEHIDFNDDLGGGGGVEM